MHYQSFNQVSRPVVIEFIRQHPFGCIVTFNQQQWQASHLVFMVEEKEDRMWLTSHLARENPQCDHILNKSEGTVIFSGPHAYISAMHYANPVSVPTWNYMAAYLFGKTEPLALSENHALLDNLVKHHDKTYYEQRFKNLPESYLNRMIPQFVGFRFHVERIEHRFKLSQEKPATDRQQIIQALRNSDNGNDREVAEAMIRYGGGV